MHESKALSIAPEDEISAGVLVRPVNADGWVSGRGPEALIVKPSTIAANVSIASFPQRGRRRNRRAELRSHFGWKFTCKPLRFSGDDGLRHWRICLRSLSPQPSAANPPHSRGVIGLAVADGSSGSSERRGQRTAYGRSLHCSCGYFNDEGNQANSRAGAFLLSVPRKPSRRVVSWFPPS